MNLKVAKFGGSSINNAEAIKIVADIIGRDPLRKVIVVSAVFGITDHLIKLSKLSVSKKEWRDSFVKFKERHLVIIQELGINLDLSDYFKDLEIFLMGINMIGELSGRSNDYILSFGERLSTEILTTYLQINHKATRIDSRDLIITDDKFSFAMPLWEKTQESIDKFLKPLLSLYDRVVITGFIGSNIHGDYTTLSRGGSDFTAAILANMLDADQLEIWTDVNGIKNVDPKLIAESRTIKQMSYKEAAELSFFGAKILHPKTIEPAIKKAIPVLVLNTFESDNPGTLISSLQEYGIKCITYKKDISIIHIYSTGMLEAKGFLAKVFSVFLQHDYSVDMVTTSEVSISVTTDIPPTTDLIKDLNKLGNIEVSTNKAIICLVGEGINSIEGIHSRLFHSLKKFKINMISQGSSPRNIGFVIDNSVVENAVKCIFKEFFLKNMEPGK